MWRGGQSILELKLMGHEDELIACGVRKKEGPDRPPGSWFEQLGRWSCCMIMGVRGGKNVPEGNVRLIKT